jgi:hypothetical protein
VNVGKRAVGRAVTDTYDVKGDNLTVGLLDLLQLAEVVPEAGLGDNVVGRKNPHAAERRSASMR